MHISTKQKTHSFNGPVWHKKLYLTHFWIFLRNLEKYSNISVRQGIETSICKCWQEDWQRTHYGRGKV